MWTREEVIALLRQQYVYLVSEYGIKRIGLFGSCARGATSAESDVNIVVEFERPIGFRFVEFVEYLESLLGRKIDVLTPAGIQGIRIPHFGVNLDMADERNVWKGGAIWRGWRPAVAEG